MKRGTRYFIEEAFIGEMDKIAEIVAEEEGISKEAAYEILCPKAKKKISNKAKLKIKK